MRIILFMLRKEFRQIFRNKAMLPIIFVAPLIQLLILSNAATYEVKNLKIYFNDFDHSTYSKRLKSKFYQTEYFKIAGESTNRKISETYLEKNDADIVFEIPPDFQKDLVKERKAFVFMKVNAIDGMKAGLSFNYANNVLVSFMTEINQEMAPVNAQYIKLVPPETIKVEYANWYNQNLDYKIFMVPGLLVMLVTLVGGFLSSMNIDK